LRLLAQSLHVSPFSRPVYHLVSPCVKGPTRAASQCEPAPRVRGPGLAPRAHPEQPGYAYVPIPRRPIPGNTFDGPDRVGDARDRPADVQLIPATHQDLSRLVAENKFRSDLYYRICTRRPHTSRVVPDNDCEQAKRAPSPGPAPK
jgi:hypothetical protein